MLTSKLPQIGIIPVYVTYFEELDRDLGRRKADFARDIVRSLERAAAGTLEIVASPMVSTVDEARSASAKLEADGADVLVVLPLIAAFGELLLAASGSGKVPVLALSIASERDVPESYTMAQMVMQSGGLGLQALCNTLTRRGQSFEVCAGTVDDAAFVASVCRKLRAMSVPSMLRRNRLGIIGSRFASMTDVDLDLDSVLRDLGIRSVELTPQQLTETYSHVSPSRVTAAIHEYGERFTIEAITREELERSARLALTLEDLIAAHQIGYGAFNSHGENCLKNPEIGVMGTLGVSLLGTAGVPLAEVADAPTGIAMAIGTLLAGCSVYAELDSVDFEHSRWFIANSGELHLDAADSSQRVVLRGSENFKGLHGRGASFDAVVKPGTATLLSFTPVEDGRYRMIAASGTIVPERRTCFHAVHALMQVSDAQQSLEQWCRAGAVHHAALIPQDVMPELRSLARVWPGVELTEIAA